MSVSVAASAFSSSLISQDKAKLKVHKRSDPIEPEVINNMVRYARKSVAQFRALKSSKNILYCRRR